MRWATSIDATLAVAGTLNRNMPEGHPFPPKSRWWYSQHGAFTAVYDTPHRSVYVMQQRIRKHPYFSLFDGADTNISTPVRTTGVTPLQSLYAMNNAFVHEQSRKVAQRLARERSDMPGRVRLAYRLLLGREPEDAELETALAYLAEYREKFKTTTTRPVDGRETALASLARVLLASNEFNYID